MPRLTGADRHRARTRAVRLYRDGLTIHAVASQLDCSYGTARTLLVEAGVHLRPKGPVPDDGPLTPELAEELRAMREVACTVTGATPLDDPAREVSERFTARLHELNVQGVGTARIAFALGVEPASVRNRLARHGYGEPPPSKAHECYRASTPA